MSKFDDIFGFPESQEFDDFSMSDLINAIDGNNEDSIPPDEDLDEGFMEEMSL